MTPPTHPLDTYNGTLATRVGAFLPGDRVLFRGQDLHAELSDASWMEIYLFGITGRRYDAKALSVFNAIWSYTSYPDTRLWNNRVAALAGTTRSTGTLGMSAALAVSEAAIYGGQIVLRSIDFLLQAAVKIADGTPLAKHVEASLKSHRSLAGYGRPIINEDERLEPLRKLLHETGLLDGPYQRLASEIESILLSGRWRMKMNFAGLAAAVCADLGLRQREYYAFTFPVFLAGMQPCYTEALEKPPAAIMPVSCTQVEYSGPPPRRWI